MLLVEQKMEHIYHLRVAAVDDSKYYQNEIRRLEGQLEAMQPHIPVTQEQAASNRKELALVMGLKPKRR
ncbi:MAG: hypothetical protein WC455_27730 [Dehalococcoidia bacterium]|jgi:hypothetical protein